MPDTPFIEALRNLVGQPHLLTDDTDMVFYTKGYRVGQGKALAVILPQSLLALWQVLELCVAHDVIILMQAANTGLTGGSTPDGNHYDRPLVVISTRYLNGAQLIDNGQQVISFPGTTLTELEDLLRPIHREPHSVIGSSCIGASVIGGLCNNSGGSLLRRGPAFTEKSLFAQITPEGKLNLVNHLGIELGETPQEMITNLQQQNYRIGSADDWQGKLWAEDYAAEVRDIAANSPARFNGDPRYLHDSAGCAGKLVVFAARLATFPASDGVETFYIGTNDEQELVDLRKVLLEKLSELPLQAEYMHDQAFDLCLKYCQHIIMAIRKLGPAAIPDLLARKAAWERRLRKWAFLPHNLVDKILQGFNQLILCRIAPRLLEYRRHYRHHLMIKTERRLAPELGRQLAEFFAARQGQYFACNPCEAEDAFLIRFAIGSAPIAYCDYLGIDPNQRLVSFDFALRRNDTQWHLTLPEALQSQVQVASCCGHFFCYVNHQDYVVKPGVDRHQFKQQVLAVIEQRGARYPAEHNVGHLYSASDTYREHWQQLDPTNSCNPGIGKTSRRKFWR